ncbi:MAG: methyltransferase domain-containing protein [Burkholderiales bacterium]|nr:methyltransferase domain-containing protein [Burkholderiales bacterium]
MYKTKVKTKMDGDLPREYRKYPAATSSLSVLGKVMQALRGMVGAPVYWCLAYATKTPGLQFRRYFALKGLQPLLRGRGAKKAYRLMVMPLDSLRYFEFEFMWSAAKDSSARYCLDVSSPRLFPLMLADRLNLRVELTNPDGKDLAETRAWAVFMGVDRQCGFHAQLIGDVQFQAGTFDLVTSMSVVEHIVDDSQAVRRMWDLLRPGGRLLITVPCADAAYDEYMNQDDYGLREFDDQGYAFFQRFYDRKLLEERLFSITGAPTRMAVYGEKVAGSYQENEYRKRTDPFHPYWRDPLDMGLNYEYKRDLSDLPGIGVVGLEFVKRSGTLV